MGVFTLACALLTLSVGVVPRVAAVSNDTVMMVNRQMPMTRQMSVQPCLGDTGCHVG